MEFLPQKDRIYENAPWEWVLNLVLIELGVALVMGLIATLIGMQTFSWVGITASMIGAMTFSIQAEKRSAGVLTKKIKSQLNLRASIAVTSIGVGYLLVMKALAVEGLNLPIWLIAVIIAISFLFTWLAHRFGLNQGQKNAARALKKPA